MRLFASTLMAGVIALGAVAPALADPPRNHKSRDWNDRDYRDGYRDARRDDRRDWRDDRRRDSRWDDRRDHRRWHRGDRFDRRVHYNYVVVNDYNRYYDRRGYRLRDPGRGHYYVRDDRTGDILLVAAATGLILWALND
jgi:Ni/Co efflux regulator RcnB